MRRRRRLACLTPLTTTAVLLLASPAAAEPTEPLDRPLAVVGTGSVLFYYDAVARSVEVRVAGDITGGTQNAGIWSLTMSGARGTEPYTYGPWTSSALTVSRSVDVPLVADSGGFTVDFAYTGVGAYVVVHLVHTFSWSPLLPDPVTAGTGITR